MSHLGKLLYTGTLALLSLVSLNIAYAQTGMSDYEFINTYLLAPRDFQNYIVYEGVYEGMDYVALDLGDGYNDYVYSTREGKIDVLTYDIRSDGKLDGMRLSTRRRDNYYDIAFLPTGDIGSGNGRMYLDSDLDGALDTVAIVEDGGMVDVGFDPEQDGVFLPASPEQKAIIVGMISVVLSY